MGTRPLISPGSEAEDLSREAPEPAPTTAQDCSCSLAFTMVLQPSLGERSFFLGHRERGDTRRSVTGDPGVLPAFPSPSPGAQGCSYLIPLRSRRCARLWGSRCGGPEKPEALDSTASWPLSGCGDSERPTRGSAQRPRSPVRPGMVNFSRGSYVGSEAGAAENVLGRDRAPTHSPLSTEPPTYFNPPPSLLPPSPLFLPPPLASGFLPSLPCPLTILICACALREKVLLTRAADCGRGARLAPASRELRPLFFSPVRPFLRC